LTEEQEKVLREEGLDIQIEGLNHTPSSNDEQVADEGIKKKVET
jgi:hypothetical protein